MMRSVYVPQVGMLEYCQQAGIYSALTHFDGFGPLSVSIRANDHAPVENCAKQIHKALSSLIRLDARARTFMTLKNIEHATLLLTSIDFYVNGEFNLFYTNDNDPLDWITVCFSKDLLPMQIEFDF